MWRLTASDLDARLTTSLLDELDHLSVVVVDGVTIDDEPRLRSWWDRAPCVVVATTVEGARPPESVDIALVGEEVRQLEPIARAASEHPVAARALVDVLRVVPRLDIRAGLVVESLAYSMLLASTDFRGWLDSQPIRPARRWTTPPVRAARCGGTLHVTVDRAANRNALSAEVRDALLEVLGTAEVDASITAVILDGAGPVFCSGGDLVEFGMSADVARAHEIRTLRSVGAAIHRLRERVTVRVRGRCAGAGVELSAFAGRVVADPDTTFRLPEVAMGLIPGAGGTVSLSRRIGRQQTADLALSGREITAEEALGIGLVDEIGPRDAPARYRP